MPTFDIVSELDLQEVRNAVDQANREATTRFDFKNTDSKIEFTDKGSSSPRRPRTGCARSTRCSRRSCVRREVSLKSLDPQKVEEASRGSARQHVTLKAGISQDVGKAINRLVKDLGLKGVSSSIQGDQVRVSGKKRDDLQAVIAACKEADLGVPLQFTNFRD